tara:strand:+ start:690 stop:1988 length:1299 start_codon:yes stop_codon:yes gene_type:complete
MKKNEKKLEFSDYKVIFLNHASYIIETEKESLLMDPWLFGRVFNDSWSLMRDTNISKIDFKKLKYLCFSHEHPDHLHWPSLKFIREKCEQQITILYPSRDNQNVKENCEKLGFIFKELKHNEETLIDNFTKITAYPAGHDNALLFKLGSKTLLNQNDAYLKKEQLEKIKKEHPTIDAWFMQFSLAGFYANKTDEKGLQEKGKDFHIQAFKSYQDILQPKTSIPFASFVYFCKKYNSYMNKWLVKLEEIKEVSKYPLQILFYDEEMSWEHDGNNEEKIKLWDEVFEKETIIDGNPKIIDETTINDLAKELMLIVKEDVEIYHKGAGRYIKLSQLATSAIFVKFYDYEKYYVLDYKNLQFGFLEERFVNQEMVAGILPLEEFESFLKFPWGADTLNVTAAFEKYGNGQIWQSLLAYRDLLYQRVDLKKMQGYES